MLFVTLLNVRCPHLSIICVGVFFLGGKVRINPGNGFGFVEFQRHQDAARAISSMEGFSIGGNQMRLTWGNQRAVSGALGSCYGFFGPRLFTTHG